MGSRRFKRSFGLAAAAALAAIAAGLVTAVPAGAGLGPNQANHQRLLGEPLEEFRYDRASKCRHRLRKGTRKLVRWLDRHTRGSSWGVYRCEKLSSEDHSIHAESRAVDWHMDARDPKMRRQAMKLIERRWLAPDRHGNPAALARRMGIRGSSTTAEPGGRARPSSAATPTATSAAARSAST